MSVVGDYVFDTTLALWVATRLGKGHSWAPAAMSGVLLAAGAAVLVVGPLAGVFVDRLDRKRLMLRTEIFRAVLVTGGCRHGRRERLTALLAAEADGAPHAADQAA